MTEAPTRLPARAGWILALAFAYAIGGRLGLLAEPVAGFASLVWPPSGIALAALVLRGRWLWPGVALGALAANLSAGAPPLAALAIAAGNTLGAVLATEGLRRASFDPRVVRVRDVLALVVIGALLSTLASASIGVAALRTSGNVTEGEVLPAFRAWWLGDAMGDLVVAPILLAWASREASALEARRALEALGVGSILVGAGLAVFGGVLPPLQEAGSTYLLFPPLVWAAVRFGQRGAATAVASLSLIAVLGTLGGHGPFTRAGEPALLELQSFMAVVATMLLVLGAAITERDQARLSALESVRVREDFLAIASHELRTPLATLVLLVGTMKKRLAPDAKESDLGQALASAERQTERLKQLISLLLEASRIERGSLALDRKPTDLAEIVRALVDRERDQATRAECEVRLSIDASVPGTWDRARIEQAAASILGNAIRYARGTPIDVRVSSDGPFATLDIRDHGPGIPVDRMEEIFQRYQRGGAKRERGGLGLGLFIARNVVEAHGGSLRAERPDGSGARFVMRLPRAIT